MGDGLGRTGKLKGTVPRLVVEGQMRATHGSLEDRGERLGAGLVVVPVLLGLMRQLVELLLDGAADLRGKRRRVSIDAGQGGKAQVLGGAEQIGRFFVAPGL